MCSKMLLCIILIATLPAQADEPVFRIGTGGNAGTYLPIGTLIAQALNEYDDPGSSGNKDGLDVLLLAQRSNGSAANVREIGSGLLESYSLNEAFHVKYIRTTVAK